MLALLAKLSELERSMAAQRDEMARLKNLPRRPVLKPSGLENATQPKPPRDAGQPCPGGGQETERRIIHEARVIQATVPNGSRFKGCADFVAQDLLRRPPVGRDRPERWLTPDGQTFTAPLPAGVSGHFGAALRGCGLAPHHHGQVTVRRVAAHRRDMGIGISRRQVMRRLMGGQDGVVDEARDGRRAGLAAAAWVSVDDTGRRHQAANGVCTQIATTTLPGSPPPRQRPG